MIGNISVYSILFLLILTILLFVILKLIPKNQKTEFPLIFMVVWFLGLIYCWISVIVNTAIYYAK